jgi:hypothetical protein
METDTGDLPFGTVEMTVDWWLVETTAVAGVDRLCEFVGTFRVRVPTSRNLGSD